MNAILDIKICFNSKTIFCCLFYAFMISCSPQLKDSVNKQITVPSRYELFESYNFEWLSPFKNNMAIAMLDGQSIVINQYGHKVLDYPYDDEKLYFFGEYLIVNNASGKMGNVIDMKGEEVFQPGYSNLRCECDCGYFTAIKSGKAGILTFEDRKFHPFDDLPIFLCVTSQGHLLIKNEKLNTTDLVSIEGKVLKRIPYKIVRELDNGNFLVKNEGSAMLLDSQFKKSVSLNYDDLKVTGMKDHIITIRDKKYGIIDANGVEILPPKYDGIRDLNGYYTVRDSTILGLMDKEMNILHRYESTCGDIFFHRPYYCCTTDSTSLVYNVNSQSLKKFPYKITYNIVTRCLKSISEGKIKYAKEGTSGIAEAKDGNNGQQSLNLFSPMLQVHHQKRTAVYQSPDWIHVTSPSPTYKIAALKKTVLRQIS